MEYLLLAIIVILIVFSFFMYEKGADLYRKGIIAGLNLSEGKKPDKLVETKPKKRAKEEQKELKRYNDILFNIENYDGSPFGQKEIK